MISEFGRPQVGAYHNSHTSPKTLFELQCKHDLFMVTSIALQTYNDEQFVVCRVSSLEDVLKYIILLIGMADTKNLNNTEARGHQWWKNTHYVVSSFQKFIIQLILELHEFELHESTYTWFFSRNTMWSVVDSVHRCRMSDKANTDGLQ